jgi:anti-anti-sigma regulatory factor
LHPADATRTGYDIIGAPGIMITETRTRIVEPDVTVFCISGRVKLENTLLSIESGSRRLIADGSRNLIVDVSDFKSIDSAGIGMFITCNAEMEQYGGPLRIAGGARPCSGVFPNRAHGASDSARRQCGDRVPELHLKTL